MTWLTDLFRSISKSIPCRCMIKGVCGMAFFLFLCSLPASAQLRPAMLQGYDALVKPRERVELIARLSTGEPLALARDIENAPIYYYLGENLLDTVYTNREGRTSLWRIFPRTGDYGIRLFYPGDEIYGSAEGYLRLFVRQPKTTFLVTDIDYTLAQTQSLVSVRSGQVDLKAQPRAAFVLRRLATEKGMTILYITEREESLLSATRDWLAEQGFPPGPVFFWDIVRSPLSHEAYKRSLLSELKTTWQNIEWGIGDRIDDMKAYEDNGMKGILLPSVPPENIPESVKVVKSWREIEDFFFTPSQAASDHVQ